MKTKNILLDIHSGGIRHVVRQTSEHVVVLHRLLDHLHPLSPHGQDGLEWIQLHNLRKRVLDWLRPWHSKTNRLIVEILGKFEESNERPSPADPSTAVNHHGAAGVLAQDVLGLIVQLQQDLRVFRGLHVGPGLAVELVDRPRRS